MSPSPLGIVASGRRNTSAPSYSSEVLADSPQGFWLLDETSGTSAADASGNSRAMTYATGVTLAQPPLYAGSTSSVKAGTTAPGLAAIAAAGWMSNTAFTVAGWFTSTNITDVAALANQFSGSTGWILWQRRSKIGILTQTSTQQEADGLLISVNKPKHIAVRLSSGVLDLFSDGVKVASITMSSTFGTLPALQFGSYSSGSFSQARFDGLAYFNTALSDSRIAAQYAAGAPTRDITPDAWWRLDETSGTTMADSSGNGRNATYSGATLGQTALRGTGFAATGGTSGQGVGNIAAAAGSVFDTGEFSVALNYKAANTNDAKGIVSRWQFGGWLLWQSGGTINFYIDSGGVAQNLTGPSISVGTNRRLTLTVAPGVAKLYVDGSLSHTWTLTVPAPTTALPVQVGGYNGSNYSAATFDEIKFWDITLTAGEVATEFATIP